MREYAASVLENKRIAENISSLTFLLPEDGQPPLIRAGQFCMLSVGAESAHLLRRPIAVCKADGYKITVCFQIKGEGTKILSEMGAGTGLNVLLPLGNGFYVAPEEKKIALVGGGAGIFPMISVIGSYGGARSENSSQNGAYSGDARADAGGRGEPKEISAYIGFRNKAAVCALEELRKADRLIAVTDDGGFGAKMNAVQAFAADLAAGYNPDVVFSCGPLPMLRALKAEIGGKNIPCYVSLEERMGCGIGACLVCVCTLTGGAHARACKDGPVFSIGDVEL